MCQVPLKIPHHAVLLIITITNFSTQESSSSQTDPVDTVDLQTQEPEQHSVDVRWDARNLA